MKETIEEMCKRTFVQKKHNAVKLTENMAREMFNAGVRIIVRPAGRNTLERGVVYQRGKDLCYNSGTIADTFEQIVADFAVGFGRPEQNNAFRFYLYMD